MAKKSDLVADLKAMQSAKRIKDWFDNLPPETQKEVQSVFVAYHRGELSQHTATWIAEQLKNRLNLVPSVQTVYKTLREKSRWR